VTTIRLTFPAGRYHATPWGRNVNEGVAEWPPSPYRLLRALYDVWQRKCFDVPAAEVQEVLEGLAASMPRFQLPPAAATHTRSYLSSNALDPTDKNLVFDSFLVFDRAGGCYISWADLDLTPRMRATLARLLNHLNYLGRSESWVEADLVDRLPDSAFNCELAAATEISGELTPVACAIPPSEYTGKVAWIDALTFSTWNLLKDRASSPPLLRRVSYVRSENAVETDPPYVAHGKPQQVRQVVLGLDSTVLPLVTTTLEVAEQIRVRLMGAHKRRMGGDESRVSPLFSGKTADGSKRLDHGHVYILPLGNSDGRIDRVLIVSPLGPFSEDELDAVRGVRRLWQRDGRPDVQCVVTWQGLIGGWIEKRAAVVSSATPFIPPRHWRKGRDFEKFLVEEVRRECRNHRVEEPVRIERLDSMPGLFHEVEYRRNRKDDPVRPGYSLRLTFAHEQATPFAIGYGAHFGLGQFRERGEWLAINRQSINAKIHRGVEQLERGEGIPEDELDAHLERLKAQPE
jgi:CRISPR-associated protein Csb2